MSVQGKRILLGVTGGIAAYKSAALLRLLVKAGADVRVVMTAAAQRFITATTLQALSGQKVWADLWDESVPDGMGHIELSRDRDLIVIAPASADFLARLATGLADDLLSTVCSARRAPLLVAPAMNVEMWQNRATRRALAALRSDGVSVVGPEEGVQACGEVGEGRMSEPEAILDAIAGFFAPGVLSGRRVLVTAGPTEEPIDPVRVITNRSSGRMGYAIAQAACEAGAQVTLVSGPVALDSPAGARRVDVRTAEQMFEAVCRHAPESDVFISVAAVADYRPRRMSEQKIKKTEGRGLTLEMVENPDILGHVAAMRDGPLCVGFAAESENLAENAQAKRLRKKVPLIAANLVQDALGAETNAITLYDDAGAHALGSGAKIELARKLVRHVADMLASRAGASGRGDAS
jgi:phosphopantothenoylcysteine decarboxylase/phosphopantothenate--cysteine ligase